MTFPQLTGNKTSGDPRSPTPTEYYFHRNTSVSLLTCRSRTQLLRPRLPGSVPEAPQHQQLRIYIHMSTKARKVTSCECECVCVCARTCEYCQKRKLPLQVHRRKNPQTLKPQSKCNSSPTQAWQSQRRSSLTICCHGQHNTIQSPCPWHICGFLSSGLTDWSSWARTTESSSSRSIHPTLLAQDEDNSKINPLSRDSSEKGEGRGWKARGKWQP